MFLLVRLMLKLPTPPGGSINRFSAVVFRYDALTYDNVASQFKYH